MRLLTLINRIRSRSASCPHLHHSILKHNFSQGALPGGFSCEALSQWAVNHWCDEGEPYVDLFHKKVPQHCIEYLNSQTYPSSELTKCFFGSNKFVPERILLTQSQLFKEYTDVPTVFSIDTKYLAWTVASESPLEIICTWEFSEMKGCTMIAYDPQLRRVYNGHGIHSSATKSSLFQALVPFHRNYADLLFSGMVEEIERKSKK